MTKGLQNLRVKKENSAFTRLKEKALIGFQPTSTHKNTISKN